MQTAKKQRLLCGVGFLVFIGAGCYFLIEGQEEGRPCKEDECPREYVCIEGRCYEEDEQANGDSNSCLSEKNCSCESKKHLAFCGTDKMCHCAFVQGGVRLAAGEYVKDQFRLVGGGFGHDHCKKEAGREFCGGFIQ